MLRLVAPKTLNPNASLQNAEFHTCVCFCFQKRYILWFKCGSSRCDGSKSSELRRWVAASPGFAASPLVDVSSAFLVDVSSAHPATESLLMDIDFSAALAGLDGDDAGLGGDASPSPEAAQPEPKPKP